MKLPLRHIALASSLVGCGAKEHTIEEFEPGTLPEKSAVSIAPAPQPTVSVSTRRPEVAVKARRDELWRLGEALVQAQKDSIEWGPETLETPGLFGLTVYADQLIWLEKNEGAVTLHRRKGETTQSKSILWFGQERSVTAHVDGETLWLVNSRNGSSHAMQYSMTGERAGQIQLVELGKNPVVDVAVDPNGGLWVATQNQVKLFRKDTTLPMEWSNTSLVSRVLVANNRFWILTIDGKLSEADLNTHKVVNEIQLPGKRVAVVHTNDGFYVATGVPDDPRSVYIHRLATDGTVRWTSEVQPISDRTLVPFEDRVVYGGVEKHVTLEASTGQVIP